MPIETVLDGDDMRTVANDTGVTRIGFDGNSCYLFLKDGAAIEVKPMVNSNLRGELKFIHRVFLPTDKGIKSKHTNKHERNKKTSKVK